MNMMEAEELLRLVTAERGESQATMRQLGNKEYVVIIKTRGLDWWVWEPNQYQEYRTARICSTPSCGYSSQYVKECACGHLACQIHRKVQGGALRCEQCLEYYPPLVPDDMPSITAQ